MKDPPAFAHFQGDGALGTGGLLAQGNDLAGMPVATLIDPRSLYLKIFVDTMQNGKIKVGDKAVIFLDAWPNRPIEAKVVRIAQKAEFTPKEVSVRSDRIQRVFAVHLKPIEPDPLLKLGIPAIGVVSLDGEGLPSSLNEIPVL
jgi:HlyD family secretion protein